ncbi:TetR/AcrR family transcriptional regulator [Mesorhizobium sp. 1M-11]|uniref:TetR/AcrR family transcriptional regulator n=1 Tax=Mesorhizobium sp. 1M-11 TaxID=1529006 RepID=UPI0006C76B29|nr:TetR/AcrR family transcriptional regulator [Mesorhizobium sp. 1M-11]
MRRIAPGRDELIAAIAEVFRAHGYAGASLSLITETTGLGKGSLYNFFPGGKDEMAAAVLAHIDRWFEDAVFSPLREVESPQEGIARMLAATDAYFHSGRRVCLVGAFALDDARDRFAAEIRSYFGRWVADLAGALRRAGLEAADAGRLAEESVAGIQGALTLARAFDDPAVFSRAMANIRERLDVGRA